VISVVLPCYESASTLAECLDALMRQTVQDFEVILVDSSPDPSATERVVKSFPSVRYFHLNRRALPHEARNRGVAEARGSILVFSDPDCRASADWLERAAEAVTDGHEFVGGSLGGLEGWRNRSIHFSKYAWWLPGGTAGPVPQIPSGNLALTRELWERIGPFRDDRWAADTEFSWRALAANVEPWFEPRAQVTHLDHGGVLPFLRERSRRGRDFGVTRAEYENWSRIHCLGRVVVSPLVPLIMLARALRSALSSGHGITWLLSSPVQALAHASWAFGEALGLLRHRP